MYPLPMPDFVTACIGHLENTSSQNYIDLLNTDTFYYIIKIHNYCQCHQIGYQKNLKYWAFVKVTVVDTGFPKFLFSFESLNFIISKKLCSCFP